MTLARTLLAALFAAFLSSQAFAADYYFETGQGAGACSEADPCSTIAHVEALSLSAGDTINFNCGDTFGATALNTTASGSSGNLITYQAGGPDCPGTDPIIGGTTSGLETVFEINHSFIAVIGLHFVGDLQSDGGEDNIEIADSGDLENIHFTDVTVDGAIEDTGAGLADAIRMGNGSSGHQLSDSSFTRLTVFNGTHSTLVLNGQMDGITFTDLHVEVTSAAVTFTDDLLALSDRSGSGGGGIVINGLTVIGTASFPAGGNFIVDVLGYTGTVINDAVMTSPSGSRMHIANDLGISPPVSVTFNDLDFEGERFMLNRNDAAFTCNRCNVHGLDATGSGTEIIQVGGTAWPASTATPVFNASSFFIGTTGPDSFAEIFTGTGLTLNNSTIVMNNAASNIRVLWQRNTPTGTLTVKNSIIVANGARLLESDGAGTTWVLDQNLYERSDQTTDWADDNGTTYTETTIVSSLDTSGSATGDPLFVTEDETSDKYLMLNTGSPGIGLGDPSNLYATPATDLLGYVFNGTTPNAGARSQRIVIKAGNDNERPPANDNEPDLGGPWAVAVRCECEPTALNWPDSFELTCQCDQRAVR